MTPDYALSLSFGGIALLVRAAARGGPDKGWYLLGEVALDTEDLAGALAGLRAMAQDAGRDGDDPAVKLILPDEQIKYLSLAPGTGDGRTEAEAALEGATPYAVADLVFDWQERDGRLNVAAVARETLEEAESFASEHGFAPMAFVAIAPDAQFGREPFFGPTSLAQTRLADGDSVTPDDRQIDILPGTAPVRVRDEVENLPANDTTATPVAKSASTGAAPDEETNLEAARQGKGEAPRYDSSRNGADAAQDAPVDVDASDASPQKAATDISGQAETAQGDERPDLVASPASVPEAVTPAPEAVAPEAPPVAFASLRASRDGGDAAPGTTAPDPRAEGKAPRISAQGEVDDPTGTGGQTENKTVNATPDEAPRKPTFADAIRARAEQSRADTQSEDMPTPEEASASLRSSAKPTGTSRDSSVGGVMARAQTGLGRGAGFMSRRKDPLAAKTDASGASGVTSPATQTGSTAQALTAGNKMNDAERMTVFGARRQAAEQIGGKPRFLGIILTTVLLLFLLGVAAWASIFVDEGLARFFPKAGETAVAPVDTATNTPDAARDSTDGAQDAARLALPDVTQTPLSPEAEGGSEALAALSPDVPPELSPGRPATALPPLTGEDGLARPLGDGVLDPEEAEARYAATGIWQRSPVPPAELSQGLLEDLTLARLDPGFVPDTPRPLAQPRSFATDTGVPPKQLPPRADERFAFDERGLILPTPEGLVTPAGYLLVAGRPDVLPPARGGLTQPDPPEAAPDSATQDTADRDDVPPGDVAVRGADSALAGFRPVARPSDLAPVDQPETQDDAAAEGTGAEETGTEDEAALSADASDASRLAVRRSLAPAARPADMARIVQRAAPPPSATRVVAATAPQTVAPRAPSRQSVTRAATQNNAINLRRINLIGVYGKPSARRALVRLSNGRFQKVKVGDRLDGGRILAISDSQLRYQKSGRNVVLDLPQG